VSYVQCVHRFIIFFGVELGVMSGWLGDHVTRGVGEGSRDPCVGVF